MGSIEVEQEVNPSIFSDLFNQFKVTIEKDFIVNLLFYKCGEFRLWRQGNGQQIMVQLVDRRKNRYDERAWLVRWALGPQEIVVDQDELSYDTYNAMEVLAWAAL